MSGSSCNMDRGDERQIKDVDTNERKENGEKLLSLVSSM